MANGIVVGSRGVGAGKLVDVWCLSGTDDLAVSLVLHHDDEDMAEAGYRAYGRRRRRCGGFPIEPISIQTALDPVGAVDPGHVPVGVGGPVVSLPPHHEPFSRVLLRVAVGKVEVLVLDGHSNNVWDPVRQRLKTELEHGRRLSLSLIH